MRKTNNGAAALRRLGPLVIAIIGTTPAQAVDFTFNPELTVAGIYTNNLFLAPSGQEESETIGEVRPGLRMTVDSQRVRGELDYQMENYFFSESSRDQTFHELDGTLESELVSEWFFFDATGRISQTLIDPTEIVAFSDFINTENRADYMAVEADPYLLHDFGNFARVRAAYSYGILRYTDYDVVANPDVQDFDDRVINFEIASLPEDSTLSWELRYNNERVEYESDDVARVEYEVYGGELAWQGSSNMEIYGRAGRESDLRQSTVTSSVEADIWAVGFRWRPSAHHRLEASVGERFFGDAYTALYSYEGSRLLLGFDYGESPLAVGQQLFQLPVLSSPVPGDPGAPLTQITPGFYISELATGWLALTGRRNTLLLTLYRDRREFLTTSEDESEDGALLDWYWRLGPRTTLFTELSWQHVDYPSSERDDNFMNGGLGIDRQLGQSTTLELSLHYGSRTSDATPVSRLYEESGIGLEFTHRFGRPPPDTTDPMQSRASRDRRGESILRGR